MEMFKPKQMMLEKLTQLGWGDTAHYFCERDKKHGTSELRIQAVVKLQMDDNAAPPASTTLGELMECLHSVPGISQMPQETSWQGTRHIRLGSGKPQSHAGIFRHAPGEQPKSSPIEKPKPVEPESY